MKSTIISMVVVLCVLAVIPTVMFSSGGILDRLGLNPFVEFRPEPEPPKNLTSVTTDKKVQVYKWRDEHGIMQFASTPPPEVHQAELVELSPDTNLMKAIEVPEAEPEAEPGKPRAITLGNPYTRDGMQDLLESTSSLTEEMEQQQLEQQQLMEQMLGIRK